MTVPKVFKKILFPLGSVQRVRKGYLKNCKIQVTENTQWAPLFGRWEPAMQKIMVNTVRPGQVVYDLGANFGLHGMLLCKLVGPSGMLYNFEPLPSNILEIENNYKLNHITNYENIQKAVSNKSARLKFSLANHATQGKLVTLENSIATTEVEAISLDEFIDAGHKAPDFIKMDIEGAEGDALQGFSKNIEKNFPEMIIELHSPEADREVGQFLKFYGYKAFRFNTFRRLNFEEIKNLSSPYPDKDGIWGSIFCIGKSKSLDQFSFDL